jgi:hypothetical protein
MEVSIIMVQSITYFSPGLDGFVAYPYRNQLFSGVSYCEPQVSWVKSHENQMFSWNYPLKSLHCWFYEEIPHESPRFSRGKSLNHNSYQWNHNYITVFHETPVQKRVYFPIKLPLSYYIARDHRPSTLITWSLYFSSKFS